MTARLAQINGRPAYEYFAGRVTATMVRQHGSYQAALEYLRFNRASSAPAEPHNASVVEARAGGES